MAEFPSLPLFTDAYLGDTTHLSTFEHGAYLLLLIVSWRSPGCCLPDNDGLLARYTRMTRDKWRKTRPILEPFFQVRDGFWHQARLQDEFQHLQSRRAQQSEAGIASATAKALKRNKRGSTSVGLPLQRNPNETSTPYPITPLAKANGPIDPEKQFWEDAKSYLGDHTKNPGAFIGGLLKDHSKGDVREAISRAQLERAVEPRGFIRACLKQKTREASMAWESPC